MRCRNSSRCALKGPQRHALRAGPAPRQWQGRPRKTRASRGPRSASVPQPGQEGTRFARAPLRVSGREGHVKHALRAGPAPRQCPSQDRKARASRGPRSASVPQPGQEDTRFARAPLRVSGREGHVKHALRAGPAPRQCPSQDRKARASRGPRSASVAGKAT